MNIHVKVCEDHTYLLCQSENPLTKNKGFLSRKQSSYYHFLYLIQSCISCQIKQKHIYNQIHKVRIIAFLIDIFRVANFYLFFVQRILYIFIIEAPKTNMGFSYINFIDYKESHTFRNYLSFSKQSFFFNIILLLHSRTFK